MVRLTEQKLLKIQKELKGFENTELKLKGSLSTLFKTLKADIGDPEAKNSEVIKAAKEFIKKTEIKISKAETQLKEKMELIEEMNDKLGVA